jgi:hypothetical protein
MEGFLTPEDRSVPNATQQVLPFLFVPTLPFVQHPHSFAREVMPLLQSGMLVYPKGLMTPQIYRIESQNGPAVELVPISLGGVRMQSVVAELRRYRLRSTDEVTWGEELVTIVRIINPMASGEYRYEIEDASGEIQEVTESELTLHEGSLAPDPASMLGQFDTAPWKLVSARMELLESFFRATARSLGILGYNGARMLPIPHQINAARYAIQFGRVRFLLADEVGLGKTVEAGLIVATLRKYFSDWQTAIFVPESLTAQWAFELYGKFGKLIYALSEEDFSEDEDGIILPHEALAGFEPKYSPQIIVVDEAHRVLREPAAITALTKLSRRAHAVLLLTATPVAEDVSNLLKLLRILDPEQFSTLDSSAALRDLQGRQGKVEAVLQAIRQQHPEHDAIMKAWKQTGLVDEEIEAHLDRAGADTSGRHELHRMASLITDRYYPGARILRYRRKFLAQDNALPFRVVDTLSYTPGKEEKAIHALADQWLGLLQEAGLSEDAQGQQLAAALFQAVHSSPLALASWLEMREGEVELEERPTADPVLLARRAFQAIPLFDGEADLLAKLAEANTRWQRSMRAVEATGRALARSPRYLALLEFLKETLAEDPDSHVLVFTAFEANVHPLNLLLRKALEDAAEVFAMDGTQPRHERERNAFGYQEFPSGSVLISDELGGEGRNFQFSSHVVHFDLPPAPWTLEQRIGRCDRVGRDEELDVDSQVIIAEGALDEAVFSFLADGVGVFNESIAPIEGELDDVVRHMMKVLIEEGADAVTALAEEVGGRLEAARERENADLLVRSAVGVHEARRIATELHDEEELLALRKATIQYARLFESMVDERENGRVAITVGEFHSLHATAGVASEMIGHFGRKDAVRHERLDFFSPGHPFIRGMAQMAMVDSPDRTSIIRRPGVREAAILFSFRISIPAEFFHFVRTLDADLRPPLLSRSAALFGTRMLRLAITLKGTIVPHTPENAAYYALQKEGDLDLSESAAVTSLVPRDWDAVCAELGEAVTEHAEDLADIRYQEKRDDFEDLVCEVIARVKSNQQNPEAEVERIMEQIPRLVVDRDAAVLLLPKLT